ncbi:hypothetical protein [Methanolobus sp.]|uniref:hypothetical protein n=1 Tax=Methanolobus sp. TaxID=1874737 RepID=UPI0025F7873B|nr:hypothetical protein [Methanolobus sp.]
MKNYGSGELKYLICSAIADGHVTCRDIFNHIEYKGNYNSFRSGLNMIKRRGFLKFAGDAKKSSNPFQRKRTYALTSSGQKFLDDPQRRLRLKEEGLHHKMLRLIEQQPEFLQKLAEERMKMSPEVLIEYVNDNLGTHYSDVGMITHLIDIMEEKKEDLIVNDKYYVETMSENDTLRIKYNEVVLENNRLKQQLRNQKTQSFNNKQKAEPVNPSKLVREDQKSQLAIHRKKVALYYLSNRMYLDVYFFQEWGYVVPVKVKGVKWYSSNSVEFLSKSNKEFERQHVKQMNPDQIYGSQFSIWEMKEDGIVIVGKGVTEKGEMIKF